MRDPGCGRRLLLRWDPALKCSGERGQVHTAPCLPLPDARRPPTRPRHSAEPHRDTRQVSCAPTEPPPAVVVEKVPERWEPGVVPPGMGRAGHSCSGTSREAAGMLALPEPCTALTAGGMGWDGTGRDRRSRSPWPAEQGLYPCGGDARQLDAPLPDPGCGEGFGSRRGPWCQHDAGGQRASVGAQLGRRLLVPAAGARVGAGDTTGPAAACSTVAGLPMPSLQPGCCAGLAQVPTSCTRQRRLGAEADLGHSAWTPFLSADGCCALAMAHDHAPEALEVPGDREPSVWHCGRKEPDSSKGPGWCHGARSLVLWGGGVCLFSSLFKPFPFVSARCFLLSKSKTASPCHLPSSTRTPSTPLAHAHFRATIPARPWLTTFPAGQAEGLHSPPSCSRANPCNVAASAWATTAPHQLQAGHCGGGGGCMARTPGSPSRLPKGEGPLRGERPGAESMAGAALPFLGDSFSPVRL